jgi:uncharacterized protein (UPF0297 family)
MTQKITDTDLYLRHVVYYFDTQMNADILNLSPADKVRFFQMVTDYADIFAKIFHKGVDIVEYVLYGDPAYSAKKYPHAGINMDYVCPIVKEYKAWQLAQNLKR